MGDSPLDIEHKPQAEPLLHTYLLSVKLVCRLQAHGHWLCHWYRYFCLLLVVLQPDGAAWRSNPSVAEKTLLGLAVADYSLALINGALPSSFDPQHSPASWWMECIFKVCY